jgi:hypothetical protein
MITIQTQVAKGSEQTKLVTNRVALVTGASRGIGANATLNKPDSSTFYEGDEKGYTDYLTLNLQPIA